MNSTDASFAPKLYHAMSALKHWKVHDWELKHGGGQLSMVLSAVHCTSLQRMQQVQRRGARRPQCVRLVWPSQRTLLVLGLKPQKFDIYNGDKYPAIKKYRLALAEVRGAYGPDGPGHCAVHPANAAPWMPLVARGSTANCRTS